MNYNVFVLGSVYTKFVRELSLRGEVEKIDPVNCQKTLRRYASKLQFGSAVTEVANDAMRILSRWERDWLVTGRQPQALIGAALILAGRMWNYRRSAREVASIVKATEATMNKRIHEFRQTKISGATMDQFREFAPTLIDDTAQPPCIDESKRRADRKRLREAANNGEVDGLDASQHQKRPRVDKDGFAIRSWCAETAHCLALAVWRGISHFLTQLDA